MADPDNWEVRALAVAAALDTAADDLRELIDALRADLPVDTELAEEKPEPDV